jgi:Tfp pilus assembly protein PilF
VPGAATRVAIAVATAVGLALATGAPAHAQKSPTAQAALGRAERLLSTNRFADAASEMEMAVRFEPRFAFGWYLLASTSRRAGDPDRAAAAYRRYAELRPGDPDPYFGLGLSLDAVADRAGALVALRRYVETDHRPASTAFVAEARKRILALEHGGAAAPGAPLPAREAEAKRLIADRKFVEAAEFLRASVKLAPADADAWYKLAFALRQAGQPLLAAKAYRRCLTLKPTDTDPNYGLGQVLVAAGRQDEALIAFQAYVKAGPEKTDARWANKARQEIARLEAAARASRPPLPSASPSRSASPSPSKSSAPGAPARTPPATVEAPTSVASARAGEPTPDGLKAVPRP